jgi:hypothetical protein
MLAVRLLVDMVAVVVVRVAQVKPQHLLQQAVMVVLVQQHLRL